MLRYFSVFLLLITLGSTTVEAQSTLSENEQKKILRQARNYSYAAEYTEAFPLYSRLYKADTNNALYNYELGIVIYEGSRDKLASKKYFEKVVELDDREGKDELFYYLGRLYHLEHNFLFATAAYSTYIAEGLPAGKAGKEMEMEVQAYIQQCEDGKDLIEKKSHILENVKRQTKDITRFDIDSATYISFENLGEEINSAFDDYGPLIMDNEEVLLFTSRRTGSTGGELYSDGQYYEDIYIANFRNGIWDEVLNINNTDYFNGALLNTEQHNATVSISPDESQLFTYSENHCNRNTKNEGVWSELEKFSEKFNRAGNYVSNVTISPDGKLLYVEAERYDSYGGRDIYKCTMQDDGTWGELQNLGPRINTEFDEVSPFLLDDKTLYFSSQGHSSIGGWDVFVTFKSDTGWTTPQNLGIPINTPFNEVNYMVAHGGSKSYYSSDRKGGYGGFDIYSIVLTESREIDTEMLEDLDKQDSLPAGEIVVEDIQVDESGALTASTVSKLNDASEQMSENPNLTVELVAIAATRELAKANAEKAKAKLVAAGVKEDRISLTFRSVEDIEMAKRKAGEVPLEAKYEETVYFGNDSKLVTDWSREKKMFPLLEWLKGKDNMVIYLSGHADHVGNAAYNLNLSKERAESVEKFLRDHGVKNEIRKEYYGETSPHLPIEEVSADPNKLIYNRRVKIVVF